MGFSSEIPGFSSDLSFSFQSLGSQIVSLCSAGFHPLPLRYCASALIVQQFIDADGFPWAPTLSFRFVSDTVGFSSAVLGSELLGLSLKLWHAILVVRGFSCGPGLFAFASTGFALRS